MTEITGAAVVTGGGSGIGMALAKQLAKQGVAVAVADIILDNARKVTDEIKAAGGKAVAIHCDVCERDSIKQMKAEATAALGFIKLVFANAGATSFEPLMDMSDDDVDWIIQVNLMGVLSTARAFLPDMMAAREGHIVATASMAGLLPGWIPVHVPYSAAKAGIIGAMLNLSLEMNEYGIRTTSYCPGGVATGMKANNSRYRPSRFGGPSEGAVHIPKASFQRQTSRLLSSRRPSRRSCCAPCKITARSCSITPNSAASSVRPIRGSSRPATTISRPMRRNEVFLREFRTWLLEP